MDFCSEMEIWEMVLSEKSGNSSSLRRKVVYKLRPLLIWVRYSYAFIPIYLSGMGFLCTSFSQDVRSFWKYWIPCSGRKSWHWIPPWVSWIILWQKPNKLKHDYFMGPCSFVYTVILYEKNRLKIDRNILVTVIKQWKTSHLQLKVAEWFQY